MPEGPEVRREADALARALCHRPLVRIDYRVPSLAAPAQRLVGARVSGVTSRGKTMVIAFDRGLVHLSHHQLYGRWRIADARSVPITDRAVRVVLATSTRVATLYSATAIALVDEREVDAHPLLARLGPDVLDRSTTPALVAARLAGARFARTTLGHLLLDQSFAAGLGNYLRSEILHVAGLRADARPADVRGIALRRLAAAIVALPRRSYRTRGVTAGTALSRTLAHRGVPRAARRFLVYDREGEPCRTCGTAIERSDVAGRGWFHCPACQPPLPAQRR